MGKRGLDCRDKVMTDNVYSTRSAFSITRSSSRMAPSRASAVIADTAVLACAILALRCVKVGRWVSSSRSSSLVINLTHESSTVL